MFANGKPICKHSNFDGHIKKFTDLLRDISYGKSMQIFLFFPERCEMIDIWIVNFFFSLKVTFFRFISKIPSFSFLLCSLCQLSGYEVVGSHRIKLPSLENPVIVCYSIRDKVST